MYPPPESVVQKLQGQVLDVVSYGKYVVHLGFESGARISFSAPFRFSELQQLADSLVRELPLMESNLMRLLGETTTKAECDTDGTLELQFSNGDVLFVYANDLAYEAYTLLLDGKEYVV
jgi:hypothetical protein